MKSITLDQWGRMNVRQRSWLVCRALGEKAYVYWHCTQADGQRVGGSYQRRSQCVDFIRIAQELTEEQAAEMGVPFPHPMATCRPVPSVAYPMYAEYDHVAIRQGIELLKEFGAFAVVMHGTNITATAGGKRASGATLEEAVCLLILMIRGFIAPKTRKKRRVA